MPDLFDLSSYQFTLPQDLIAKSPVSPRDHSRLLIVNKQTGNFSEIPFRELSNFLEPHDHLIFNNTKVIPARLFGTKSTGAKIEIVLIKEIEKNVWEVLARPGRRVRENMWIQFASDFRALVLEDRGEGLKRVRFESSEDLYCCLDKYGKMPLPPYMEREEEQDDRTRYQTVYAQHLGSVAAPTAGLHFTEDLLKTLHDKKVEQTAVLLHVGLGTFKPVQVTDIRQHVMHAESVVISAETADKLNNQKQGRRFCVGTTTCRSLETACNAQGDVIPGAYETALFITPGYQFRFVTNLITNFHLPGSSLLMLTCALGGYELIMEAYQKAIKDRFRFYSYGDAMLILS